MLSHAARRALSRAASTSAASPASPSALAASLAATPDAAAVAAALPPPARARLLAALLAAESGARVEGGESSPPPPRSWAFPGPNAPLPPGYVAALHAAADIAAPRGSLDAGELATALRMHETVRDRERAARAAARVSPLTAATLARLALAVGVPYVGFGFVDNFVMLLAGDEIEAVFGARFGLSTLAAAGLGNLVSDVAGLGLADRVEAAAARTRWGAPVRLAPADEGRGSVRAARVAGSVVGVSVGCLLGLVPLVWL